MPHRAILLKLEHYGVRGKELQFFESYLSNREMVTSLGKLITEPYFSNTGIPQGSHLGPLLYVIFTIDIQNCHEGCKIIQYADDTSVIIPLPDITLLHKKIAEMDSKISSWSKANGLKLNRDKTQVLVPYKGRAPEIPLGHLQLHSSISFLGTVIDENLKRKTHVSMVINKANKGIYCIRKLRNVADLKILTTVYYSLIQCHLAYAITTWGRVLKPELDRQLKCQKKAIRAIIGIPIGYKDDNNRIHVNHIKEHFIRLGIMTFPNLYFYYSAKELKKKQVQTTTGRQRLKRPDNNDYDKEVYQFYEKYLLKGNLKEVKQLLINSPCYNYCDLLSI